MMKRDEEEDFIKFETAVLARSKGFVWRETRLVKVEGQEFPGIEYTDGVKPYSGYNRCFNESGQIIHPKLFNLKNPHYASPTHAVLARWLREKHNIFISIEIGHDENKVWYNAYLYKIEKSYNYEPINLDDDLSGDTVEEAMEAALFYALNLI